MKRTNKVNGMPIERPKREVSFDAMMLDAFEEAIERGIRKIRAGGPGRYIIPFKIGTSDIKLSVVLERVAVKLRAVPKKIIVP